MGAIGFFQPFFDGNINLLTEKFLKLNHQPDFVPDTVFTLEANQKIHITSLCILTTQDRPKESYIQRFMPRRNLKDFGTLFPYPAQKRVAQLI